MPPLYVVCCLKMVDFKVISGVPCLFGWDGTGSYEHCSGKTDFTLESVVIERVRVHPEATLNRLC